jgi:heme A synthase
VRSARFVAFAVLTLAANLFVIAWGAYVRASGSGAGCGSHWPLCNGEVLPQSPAMTTMVEFTHRVTSGLALLMVLGLVVWAFRSKPRGNPAPVRLGAIFSLVFIIGEALVGAGLVLFEMVAQNESIARAMWMAVHLVNTFFLLGALTLTVWWSTTGRGVRLRDQGATGWLLLGGALGLLLVGASGGVTALGDTLYPAASLQAGLQQDFSPTAAFLIRLRVLHPMIAISVGIAVAAIATVVHQQRPDARPFARVVIGLFLVQLAAGALNVALAAPIWLQLSHLLLADAVWISYVLLAAATLVSVPARAAAAEPALQLSKQPA